VTQSPFIIGRPLRVHEPLFGREEQLQLIDRSIHDFSCVNIVGDRRMGKTSLINHLIARSYDYRVLAKIDLQRIVNAKQFYGKAQIALIDHLAQEDRELTALKNGLHQSPNCESEASTFEQTLAKFKALGLRPVIVIDEFEQLFKPHVEFPFPHFYDQFRAWITAEQVTVIVATRRPLYDYLRDPKYPNVIPSDFPNLFTVIRLRNLGDPDCAKLFQQARDTLTTELIALAREWAVESHPCTLQVAARAVWQIAIDGWSETQAYEWYQDNLAGICGI
jgi:hypothetical protein